MQVQPVTQNNIRRNQSLKRHDISISQAAEFSTDNTEFISNSYYRPINTNGTSQIYNTNISFCANKSKKIFVGAEFPPYWKKGGVATVMKDYAGANPDSPVVIFYYNGKVYYNPETGEPTGRVEVLKDKSGNPIFSKLDQSKYSMDEILRKEGETYYPLETVASKTMQWGNEEAAPITLYRVKGSKNHYMIYTDLSAKMPEVYKTPGGPQYASTPEKIIQDEAKKAAKDLSKDGWGGTYEGKCAKAFVELMPALGSDAETVVCSDAQTAFIPHFMSQSKNPYWADKKPTFVAHNLADGYTGSMSFKDMVVNLGLTRDEIKAIQDDPNYLESFYKGGEKYYFKNLIPELIDAKGTTCADMIPLRLREDGYLGAFTTVSEEYAKSVAENPNVAPALQPLFGKLYNEGKVAGILNPLEDPTITFDQPIGLQHYKNSVKLTKTDGTEINLDPLKSFTSEMTLDEVNETKRLNKINLLSRLTGDIIDTDLCKAAGRDGAKLSLIGNIDTKWIQKLENKEPVTMFTCWGRGDRQKGLDITLDSFSAFAKTEEGKNSILVIGGELGDDKDTQKAVKSRMKLIMSDENLRGRVVYMDGFAPGQALASAADCTVLPSRWAPCELADLEALLKLSPTIVPDIQGMAQKNFDPDINGEEARATSYRTQDNNYTSVEKLRKKIDEFEKYYSKKISEEKLKLKLRGVQTAKIDAMAKENIESTPEFKDFRQECIDELITKEVTDCMHRFINRPREIAQRMLDNMRKLNTKGTENGALHPSGKSTWQLYDEIHFQPDPTKPNLNLSQHIRDYITKIHGTNGGAGGLPPTDKPSQINWKSLNTVKKALIIGAGVAVALDIGATVKHFHDIKKKQLADVKKENYKYLEEKNNKKAATA
ncbi:MAG: glycogen/starch synthase [Clostridiaceae bacterium]|jgi:hypothetical protein|nr:glycogen/starch synthase [Clostridiaceae bacterium]